MHLDDAVTQHAERAFEFLERLVAAPSTVGAETGTAEVLAAELSGLGFEVQRLPIRPGIADDPVAGVPWGSYEGRYDVLGRRTGTGRSLLLNGHMDVVPADDTTVWTHPPFEPRRRGGWLYGRGAGDMKCGFAMGTLAIRALDAVTPGGFRPNLSLLGVIEEECTGNGTLSAVRDGVLADAVVLLEPTDLEILLGGVGVLWMDVEVRGRASHAESADRSVNPVDSLLWLLPALRGLEAELNGSHRDPEVAHLEQPYNISVGVVESGDWPSSVASRLRARVRVGFPRTWTVERAEARFREVVLEASRQDPRLAEHPPRMTSTGFRAAGYHLPEDAPLARALADAHLDAHGHRPGSYVVGSTTDARFYLNEAAVPALCYGPVARDLHGVDESVELDSIVRGARTLARFLQEWCR